MPLAPRPPADIRDLRTVVRDPRLSPATCGCHSRPFTPENHIFTLRRPNQIDHKTTNFSTQNSRRRQKLTAHQFPKPKKSEPLPVALSAMWLALAAGECLSAGGAGRSRRHHPAGSMLPVARAMPDSIRSCPQQRDRCRNNPPALLHHRTMTQRFIALKCRLFASSHHRTAIRGVPTGGVSAGDGDDMRRGICGFRTSRCRDRVASRSHLYRHPWSIFCRGHDLVRPTARPIPKANVDVPLVDVITPINRGRSINYHGVNQ